ncbi:OmpA family protein [bacterium AH-315-N03]|nr:OmpA family protein [bacterium AH-315-N03]
MRHVLFSFALFALLGCGGDALRLRRVVLYQNGIGYFERAGVAEGNRLRLELREHEVDDVMKTLTVIGADGSAALTAVVPESVEAPPPDEDSDGDAPPERTDDTTTLEVRLGGASGPLTVTYAVPTPSWRAVYRVVLPDDGDEALLQAWAVVHNASNEDWDDVQLTLATGAPFTYAIDLRTPRFTARPDLTGTLVEPVVRSAVRGTRSRDDGDGVDGENDLCPTEPEDRDGFQDEDGCPDPDNDQDRILDVDDACPNEPETYNGTEDEDGCPDRGAVVIQESSIVILEKIYFTPRSSELLARSRPIVDAIAATLTGNPHITLVTIRGHAARNESGATRLSRARALAVQRALTSRGVASSRLRVEASGHTQPVDPRSTREAHERNRRVEFRIDYTTDGPTGAAGGENVPAPARVARASRPRAVTVESTSTPVRALITADDSASETRYSLEATVSIPRRSATMVAIINQRVPGSQVLLFRPDGGAPLSARHPFRAARIVNESALTLIEGTVALFAGGTYAGESILDGLAAGEATFLPYAFDRSTTVIARPENERRPNRLISIANGVMVVEDHAVRRTTYEVRVGARSPGELWIQHSRAYGHEPVALPPRTEQSGSSLLIPVTLEAGEEAQLVVEERRPVQTRYAILDGGTNLAVYVASATDLPAPLRAALERALAQRLEIGELEGRVRDVRQQVGVQSRRLSELQGSLAAIERSRSAGELRRQLQQRLATTEAESERLTVQEADLTAQIAEGRVRLTEAVRELRFERDAD